MSNQLVQIFGYVLAAVAAMAAASLWSKLSHLRSFVREAGTKFEELRRHSAQVEERARKDAEKLAQVRDSIQRLEKATEDARSKASNSAKLLETKEQEFHLSLHRSEIQREHLVQQVQVLTQQLQEADQVRKDSEMQLAAQLKDSAEKGRAAQEPLQAKIRELRSQLQEADRARSKADSERQALAEKMKNANPDDVKRAMRRMAQYGRLYESMRGLREMADERNRNWESALRHLSGWILKTSDTGSDIDSSAAIGPLVGAALEIVGEQLVIDDEEMTSEQTSGAHHADGPRRGRPPASAPTPAPVVAGERLQQTT